MPAKPWFPTYVYQSTLRRKAIQEGGKTVLDNSQVFLSNKPVLIGYMSSNNASMAYSVCCVVGRASAPAGRYTSPMAVRFVA